MSFESDGKGKSLQKRWRIEYIMLEEPDKWLVYHNWLFLPYFEEEQNARVVYEGLCERCLQAYLIEEVVETRVVESFLKKGEKENENG